MRIKYCYERCILDHGLMKDFKHYCYRHSNIKSQRRLARNFLLSRGFRTNDFILSTKCQYALDEAIRIVKTPWID